MPSMECSAKPSHHGQPLFPLHAFHLLPSTTFSPFLDDSACTVPQASQGSKVLIENQNKRLSDGLTELYCVTHLDIPMRSFGFVTDR